MSATNSKLGSLHEAIAEYYLKLVRSGDLDSKDAANINKFLKDNHIECDPDNLPDDMTDLESAFDGVDFENLTE